MLNLPLAPEINVIHPNESLLFAFEYSRELNDGESLSGTPTVVELDTTLLTIGSPAISGTQVQVRLSVTALTENTMVYVRCVCGTSASNTRTVTGRLKLSRQEGDIRT